MNSINTDQLLTQLRAAAAQAQGPQGTDNQPAQPAAAAGGAEGTSFASLMEQSLDKVNEMQNQSGALKKAFEMGDPNVSLPEVSLASNKAGLAFQATLNVRNKVVDAYKEIMRMQV